MYRSLVNNEFSNARLRDGKSRTRLPAEILGRRARRTRRIICNVNLNDLKRNAETRLFQAEQDLFSGTCFNDHGEVAIDLATKRVEKGKLVLHVCMCGRARSCIRYLLIHLGTCYVGR